MMATNTEIIQYITFFLFSLEERTVLVFSFFIYSSSFEIILR